MKIKDIMTSNVEVIQNNATVQEAAAKMRGLNVGAIPVVDGKEVVGMLTDRDIVIRSTAAGRDPSNTSVKEVMTPKFVYCFEDQDVRDAAKLMSENQIRRLPVVDKSNQLVGIVSLGDFSVEAKDDKAPGKVLEDVSRPSRPDR